MLAGIWQFARKRLTVPGMEGSISQWICQLHGIDRSVDPEKTDELNLQLERTQELLASFGPMLDPEEMKHIHQRGDAISRSPSFAEMADIGRKGNWIEYNDRFKQMMETAMGPFQPNLPIKDFSLQNMCQLRRAVRATMLALVFHDAHPLTLIARSWKGDRTAALELVKIDRLFLHDPATSQAIRSAEFEHDQNFINDLAVAQKAEPRLHRRDLIRLYMCLLFMLEQIGQTLPRIDELQRLVDPTGKIYPGDYAFERDLQRRRERFLAMLKEAATELTNIHSFYKECFPQL
jgi:hypothetical protein